MNVQSTLFRAGRDLAFGAALVSGPLATASVTLNYQFLSPELPAGTRCLLVASTADSVFGQAGDLAGTALESGAIFGQDNVVLAVMTAETLPGSVTGVAGAITLQLTGGLDAGDPLRLIWLPGLGAGEAVVPLGTGFVGFRTEVAGDGSTIGYALPADGSTESVYSIGSAYGGTTDLPGSVPATVATYPSGQDSDGDRLEDLLEFAMGLDVYQSNTPQQPTLGYINNGANLRFEFGRREDLAVHGLVFGVQTSFTLLEGSWAPISMQPSATPGRWEVVVPAPAGPNARQFFRFRLENP